MLMIAWTLMKKQERFGLKHLCAQTEPIAAGKIAEIKSGGISQVQRGGDRGL